MKEGDLVEFTNAFFKQFPEPIGLHRPAPERGVSYPVLSVSNLMNGFQVVNIQGMQTLNTRGGTVVSETAAFDCQWLTKVGETTIEGPVVTVTQEDWVTNPRERAEPGSQRTLIPLFIKIF
jgi:hypothetical protein